MKSHNRFNCKRIEIGPYIFRPAQSFSYSVLDGDAVSYIIDNGTFYYFSEWDSPIRAKWDGVKKWPMDKYLAAVEIEKVAREIGLR